MSKRFVILDTGILKKAQDFLKHPGRHSWEDSKYSLLLNIILRKCHRIVLDFDEGIISEYQQVVPDSFLVKYLWAITTQKKDLEKIKFAGRVEISLPGFDPDDKMFLEVAVTIRQMDPLVVSCDSDFFVEHVLQFAERNGFQIVNVDDALEELQSS